MNDYKRIEAIIKYATEHFTEQPNLEDLAARANLSMSHFHRLFHAWAGVSPKQFLQYLTAESAKVRLRNSSSILNTSLEVGLSGPGRLHDLFVTLVGVTPGEFKRLGNELTIHWGFSNTTFGQCSLAWTKRGICHLAFSDDPGNTAPAELLKDWPHATLHRSDREAAQLAERIFVTQTTPDQPLRLWVQAKPFQLQVWSALLRIPDGCLYSYGQIARAIGKPKAARAVGTACGQNPIGYLIPCHRVIRQTGIIDGYRWGTPRKQAMLCREAAMLTNA